MGICQLKKLQVRLLFVIFENFWISCFSLSIKVPSQISFLMIFLSLVDSIGEFENFKDFLVLVLITKILLQFSKRTFK